MDLTYYTTFFWIMVAPCAKKAKNTLPQYGVIISFLALLFNRFLALFPFSSVFYNLVKFSHFVRILLSHRTCAKLGGLGQCQQSFGILGFKGGDTTLQKCGKLRRIGWCIRRQAATHQKAVDAAKHGQHPRVAAAPAISHGMAAGQHQQHHSSQQAPPPSNAAKTSLLRGTMVAADSFALLSPAVGAVS